MNIAYLFHLFPIRNTSWLMFHFCELFRVLVQFGKEFKLMKNLLWIYFFRLLYFFLVILSQMFCCKSIPKDQTCIYDKWNKSVLFLRLRITCAYRKENCAKNHCSQWRDFLKRFYLSMFILSQVCDFNTFKILCLYSKSWI